MTKSAKMPTAREAAERRILKHQGEKLDAACDHLVESARVLIGTDPSVSKVATLAAHIVNGETDINRVAQVAVRLAWRVGQARQAATERAATAIELQAELAELRAQGGQR